MEIIGASSNKQSRDTVVLATNYRNYERKAAERPDNRNFLHHESGHGGCTPRNLHIRFRRVSGPDRTEPLSALPASSIILVLSRSDYDVSRRILAEYNQDVLKYPVDCSRVGRGVQFVFYSLQSISWWPSETLD